MYLPFGGILGGAVRVSLKYSFNNAKQGFGITNLQDPHIAP
jgi:fluoride ion exporter CrcB/FEX